MKLHDPPLICRKCGLPFAQLLSRSLADHPSLCWSCWYRLGDEMRAQEAVTAPSSPLGAKDAVPVTETENAHTGTTGGLGA